MDHCESDDSGDLHPHGRGFFHASAAVGQAATHAAATFAGLRPDDGRAARPRGRRTRGRRTSARSLAGRGGDLDAQPAIDALARLEEHFGMLIVLLETAAIALEALADRRRMNAAYLRSLQDLEPAAIAMQATGSLIGGLLGRIARGPTGRRLASHFRRSRRAAKRRSSSLSMRPIFVVKRPTRPGDGRSGQELADRHGGFLAVGHAADDHRLCRGLRCRPRKRPDDWCDIGHARRECPWAESRRSPNASACSFAAIPAATRTASKCLQQFGEGARPNRSSCRSRTSMPSRVICAISAASTSRRKFLGRRFVPQAGRRVAAFSSMIVQAWPAWAR